MNRIVRISFFLLLLIWCAGFSNSLFLNFGESQAAGLLLKPFYSPVCHQLHERSFSASSADFLVCARCSGIYIGALLISFISLFISGVKGKYIIPASLLLLADVAFTSFGIYSYSKTFAFFTGLLFGLALFPYILSSIENSLSKVTDEVK